jgi:4-phosphopantoate--beta-alanine ligase
VDEVTRALPLITRACEELSGADCKELVASLDNDYLLSEAIREMTARLSHALD